MKFPTQFYLTAIAFVYTSILVQSFCQLVVPRDPRTDNGPTKKLSRISAVYGALSIRSLNPNPKAPDIRETSVLGKPFYDVIPVKKMVTAKIVQNIQVIFVTDNVVSVDQAENLSHDQGWFQAGGDSGIGRYLIFKRDTKADNAEDKEQMEFEKTVSEKTSGSLLVKKAYRKYRRGVPRGPKLKQYRVAGIAISLRLQKIDFEYNDIDTYTVMFLNSKTSASDNPRQYGTTQNYTSADDQLKCKLWDNVICFEDVVLPEPFPLADINDIIIKVTGYKNGKRLPGKEWECPFQPDQSSKPSSQPASLSITLPSPGVAKVKWTHPFFPYTKIESFKIQLNITSSSLIEFPKIQYLEINHLVDAEQKEYETEIPIYPSSMYQINVSATNVFGPGWPMKDNFTTPSEIDFAPDFESADIPSMTRNGTWIEKVPAVINATVDTWVTVTLEGNLKCKKNAPLGSPSTDEISISKSCVVDTYKVNESAPWPFNISENGTSCSGYICYLEPGYRYTVKAEAKHTSKSAVFKRSFKIYRPGSDGSNGEASDGMNTEEKPNLGWLAIFPVIAVAVTLLFVWNRKRRKSLKLSKRPSYLEVIPLTPTVASTNNLSALTGDANLTLQSNAGKSRTSAYLYSVPNEPDSWRVPVENFEEYVKNAVSSAQLNSQFKLLPKGSTKPSDYGRFPENIRKNRSMNLIAYDDTRVILWKTPGEPYSDYINANYISGFGKERAYIATQGPMANTVEAFWRMVWQEDVRIICMLTNVVEGGEKKCEQYWPDIRDTVRYGDVIISNTEHQVFADYTFRSFKLSYRQETRKVAHLHYTGWPSFGIPTYPQSLAMYLKKLLKLPAGDGPVVVHCHTGDDRTGTIILCDICLREVVQDKVIDVPGVTKRLRESRANMVGTLQQFLLAHIMIAESLMARPTQVPCDNILPKRIVELRGRLLYDIERLNDTMWQQQTLKRLAEPKPLLGIAESEDYGLPVTGTSEVIYANLHSPFESRISQIGAVSVDGVKMKRQHLASHLPPPLKLSEFWGFVIENDVKLIIILQCSDPDDPNWRDIMPDESIVLQMPNIEFVAQTNIQDDNEAEYFKSEKLMLLKTSEENTEPQSVTVLTCRGWARGSKGKLPEPMALVSLWMASERIPREEGQTLVLCHDGITACGLYLAMSFLLERMAVERECDVISAVRAVRRSRPEFVPSVEQFKHLYNAAETYTEFFQHYWNFT